MGKNLIRKSNSVNQGRSFTSLQMFHAHRHTHNDFRHVMKHVGMSQSVTPATRNEATRPWTCPKATAFAELAIGTAIRPSRERLRTVANGCGQSRTVSNGCGRKRNVERTHPQPPDHQSETGTLATHSGKNRIHPAPHQNAPVKNWRSGSRCLIEPGCMDVHTW